MALKLRRLDYIGRLKAGEWAHEIDRDGLIRKAVGPNGAASNYDMVDLLFVRDQEVRKATLKRIKEKADLEMIDAFVLQGHQHNAKHRPAVARNLLRALPTEALAQAALYLNGEDEAAHEVACDIFTAAPIQQPLLALVDQWMAETSLAAAPVMANLKETLKGNPKDPLNLLELAEKGIHHSNPAVRQESYLALAIPPEAKYLDTIVHAYGREIPELQDTLYEILEGFADAEKPLTKRLMPLLYHERPSSREAAVMFAGMTRYLDKILSSFIREAPSHKPWARERSFEAMRSLRDRLLEPIVELMHDKDPEVRLQTIGLASGLSTDARMVRPLIQALQEDDWWTRARAIEALGQVGEAAALEPLTELLDHRDTALLAVHALCIAATELLERGQQNYASRALRPLFDILRRGHRGKAFEREERRYQAELRREIIEELQPIPDNEILAVVLESARMDRDYAIQMLALETASEIYRDLNKPFDQADEIRQKIDLQLLKQARLREMDVLLKRGRDEGASEIYVAVDKPLIIRKQGELLPLDKRTVFHAARTARLVRSILNTSQANQVASRGQLDFCHEIEGVGRYRVSVYVDNRGVNAVFRVIPRDLPTLTSTGLPPEFADAAYWHSGLVLVSGSRGSGKTTTLAALIEQINLNRQCHVVSLEEPIEYIHRSRRSQISQREAGTHTHSFARAMRGALRQNPDVIVISDLRDETSIELAFKAANNNCLVIAGVRAHRVHNAMDRIIRAFSPSEHPRARGQLAGCLRAVLSQSLIPRADQEGMAAAFEVLVTNDRIKEHIKRGEWDLIEDIILEGSARGVQAFDDALMHLYKKSLISAEDAYRRAYDKEQFEELLYEEEEEQTNEEDYNDFDDETIEQELA